MAKTKILFITHEMSPFLELSKISEITRQLPQVMQEKGYEIRILMPRFGNINERRNRLHEVIRLSGMNIVVDNNDNPLIIKVASIPSARMQVYFLDNEEYFQRKHVFSEGGKFFDDNNERTVFFCKGALETVKKLGWSPDVIHCHGWMSALVPAYIKTAYKDDPTFKDTKIVYSLYEEDCSIDLGDNFAQMVLTGNMTEDDVKVYESGSYCGLYKGALHYTDVIVTGGDKLDENLLNIVKNSEIPIYELNSHEDFENYCNLYDQFSSVDVEETIDA